MSENSKTNTELPNASLLNTQTNAEKSQPKEVSFKSTFTNEPIEDTPFHIVGNSEEGYIIVMGNYKISNKPYATMKDAYQDIIDRNWDIIFNFVATMFDALTKMGQKPNGE